MLFYANGSKEKNGIVPIMGRVTINGTVAQFSCKRSIAKELWDAKGNRAKGKSVEARETNLALDNIKAQIIKHYQRISDREAYVTAEMVRNAYQGIGCEYKTILGAFDKENAKFVLCSNNEHLPVIIDAGETRYWVRKIVPLRSNDTDFLQKLKAEIPTFLHFLQHRQLFTEKESRMWFDPKRLETDALRKIIRSNRNRLEIGMAELLLDIMASVDVSSVSFCLNDIIPLLVCSQVKVEKSQVRKVVQECWKLAPASNSLSYTTYQYDYNRECRYSPVRRIGRYYTVSKSQLEML